MQTELFGKITREIVEKGFAQSGIESLSLAA